MTYKSDEVLQKGRELKAKLMADPDGFQEYNELLSQFSRGFPMEELRELLRFPNDRVISGALFCAEELHDRAIALLDDIIPHATHVNPRIRISAFEAIACVSREEGRGFVHVCRGILDCDASCRKMAALWMMRVRDVRLKNTLQALGDAGVDEVLRKGLNMVLGDLSRDPSSVKAWIAENDPLVRKFGVIAAARLAQSHPELLELAAQSDDVDLQMCATTQKRYLVNRHQWPQRT